jgi:phage putative head morphogenesis protein, SPP1 gp7|nr:MAG TPA: minor capsid protein [Caudoviricetes sp.]
MADIEDLTLQNAVRLEGVKAHLSAALRERLLALRDGLKRLLDGDDEISALPRRDMQKLYAEIEGVLDGTFSAFADGLHDDLRRLAEIMAAHEAAALSAAGAPAVKTVSAAALASLLDERVLSVEGIYSEPLLDPFIRHYADTQKTRIAAAVRQGVAQGKTNAQIRQLVTGTKKAGYNDGIIGASLRSGDALVRTAVQHVSSSARQAAAEANADIVSGVKMVATLDARTSTLCRSMDGKVFPLDKGPRPPFHINCRTSFALVLKPEYAGRDGQGKRAAAGGAVSDGLSYYEWLQKQPAAFQDEALGRTRGALFRSGGLSAKQFADLQLDRSFRPRTLDELRDLIPEAFRRAGL